jgi:hypothetical protein
MTTASSIITAAFRKSNLIAKVSTLDATELAEGLALLNPILLSAVGFEAGEDLADLNIGGTYDQSAYCSTWIPANVRLILNQSGARTLNLHPSPYEGQRLAIADAAGNLATYNLTLSGNGRTIEGATSLILSTNGDSRQWLYRADTANWVKMTSLATSDSMPFPVEFDTYFITRLAIELNPQYGGETAKETLDAMQRIERKLRARYRKPRPVQDMPAGLLNGNSSAFGLGINDFNAGRTFR